MSARSEQDEQSPIILCRTMGAQYKNNIGVLRPTVIKELLSRRVLIGAQKNHIAQMGVFGEAEPR